MYDEIDKEKRRKQVEKILNHQVKGEVYIITPGRLWKAIVLKYFNKVQRGELSVKELVKLLETKYGVKYAQKHNLVRYPIEDCLKYIAKVSKKPIVFTEE